MKVINFLLMLIAFLLNNLYSTTKKEQVVYLWNYPQNFYFILPTASKLKFPSENLIKTINQWGVGFTTVGWEKMSLITGIELKGARIKVKYDSGNFYIVNLLLGFKYIFPKENRKFWVTSSLVGEFGLSGSNLFAAPVFSVGLIYPQKNIVEPIYSSQVINGFSFELFLRPVELEFDNACCNKKGVLKPQLGIKAGYIFEGFWSQKVVNK